jgi:hypothetical protein
VRGQEDGVVSEVVEFPRPVVSGAASFEEYGGWLSVGEEGEEAVSGEPVTLVDVSRAVRDGDLED